MASNAKRRARRAKRREEKRAPVARLTSVYSAAGLILQKDCDPAALRGYARARNARIVAREDGSLLRIDLIPLADESELKSIAGSPSTTYTESLCEGAHSLLTLKKLRHGHLVKWSGKEKFTRGRFNPDDQVGELHTRKSWRPPMGSRVAA